MLLIVHIIVYRSNFFLTISSSTGKVFFVTNSGNVGFKNMEKRGMEAFSSILSVALKQILGLKGKNIFFKVEGIKENLLENMHKNFVLALKQQNIVVIGYKIVNTIPHNGCREVKK